MKSTSILAIAALAASLAGMAALGAQQELRPTPGPGSGTMKVVGTVDIGSLPPVEAIQRGDWKVVVGPPEFVAVRGRYTITWPGGERETITVDQLATGGWVRATVEGRARWINLAVARSVEEGSR
jgi:hypothetical protein